MPLIGSGWTGNVMFWCTPASLHHTLPELGSDDFQAGTEHNLALVRPVAGDGTFVGTSWPEIEGRLVTARETGDLIVQRLKHPGRWHLPQPHAHTSPPVWPSPVPLLYPPLARAFVPPACGPHRRPASGR